MLLLFLFYRHTLCRKSQKIEVMEIYSRNFQKNKLNRFLVVFVKIFNLSIPKIKNYSQSFPVSKRKLNSTQFTRVSYYYINKIFWRFCFVGSYCNKIISYFLQKVNTYFHSLVQNAFTNTLTSSRLGRKCLRLKR